jgi:hypothetical protein
MGFVGNQNQNQNDEINFGSSSFCLWMPSRNGFTSW